MPALYIANLTQQIQKFCYHVPEHASQRTQDIPIGGQILISGSEDMNQPQIDAIIKQHERYGMVPADRIDGARAFAGVCYSVGKPVNTNKIRRGLEHNVGVLMARGKKTREESAIAMNSVVEDALNRKLGHMEIEVQEEPGKGEDVLFGKETTLVTRGEEPPPRQRRRAGAR